MADSLSVLVIFHDFPHVYRTFFDNQLKGLFEGGHDLTILSLGPSSDAFPSQLAPFDVQKRTFYAELPPTRRTFDIVYIVSARIMDSAIALIDKFGIEGKVVMGFHLPVQENDHHPHIDCYLPCCERFADQLTAIGVSPKNILVHHCGVNLMQFNYRWCSAKVGRKVRIVSVARLVSQKGLHFAIHAIKKLSKKYKMEYLIIGNGPEYNSLNRLIKELKLTRVVKLLGYQTHAKVVHYLAHSDIFILPSFEKKRHAEGIPTSIMEAMAMELPVVSTRHSGIPEVVIEGETGFLVEEKDISGLAAKLAYLMDHEEIWPRMGVCGRSLIESDFNEEKQNKRLCEIFQSLNTNSFTTTFGG